MQVKPSTRVYLRLLGLGFALGVMFQTGVGVASHFNPQVKEIHIITSQGASAPEQGDQP